MVIKDERLEPFYIEVDAYSYTVRERKNIKSGKNAGEETNTPIAWCTDLICAVTTIIRELDAKTDIVVSLEEYKERISDLNKIIHDTVKLIKANVE